MLVGLHYAITAKTHRGTLETFGKDTLKRLKVRTLFEYPQPSVSTVENVISDTADTFSFRTRHNYRLNEQKAVFDLKIVF